MRNERNLSLFGEAASNTALLSRRDHLTFKGNNGRGRHGWLRLTPAYSLQLVEHLVAECSNTDLVLDPFCGTGTTALVCSKAGLRCHTVDINPFLVWLAKVKCTAYQEYEIAEADAFLNKALRSKTRESDQSRWVPALHEIEKWWNTSDLAALAHFSRLLSSSSISEAAKNLLRITFCRVAIQISNASFNHQSMSFRKRTETSMLFEGATDTTSLKLLFQQTFHDVATTARVSVGTGNVDVHLGDSRHLDKILSRHKFTTVITSPPYPNRMSYIRELRPYMYWLGYLNSGRQAGELDWQAIGGTWGCATSNLMKWEPSDAIIVPYEGFDDLIDEIKDHSEVLARYVHKYFEDAVLHVRSLRKVLARNAKIFYVVGNSKFYDVMVHVEGIYADLFRSEGFRQVKIEKIRKRTSKKELYEYVVSARSQ